MATWVSHLMIADRVLKVCSNLDRRGFCVGNIAPDCNVENADWTAFTPSREVTHWMQGERKVASDCDLFYEEYILKRGSEVVSKEQYAFLAGYYAHLITDASFQKMIRDEERIKAVWKRLKADAVLREKAMDFPETWDTVKRIIPNRERMKEIYALETEYLSKNPGSGYLTEILPLKEFPDYIDYLPHGCIVRKIGVMGYMPQKEKALNELISISQEEYEAFADETVNLVLEKFKEKKII